MRRMKAVSPILCAFVCGYSLPELLWAIETNAGIHSFTDLYLWIVVPVMGLGALFGVWRAFAPATPPQTPN